jgi:hypothetical protein
MRYLLEQAGVVAPHTGEPLSEAMVLGLGGGVGFSYYQFQWMGAGATFFVSGRQFQHDNQAFLENVAQAVGLRANVTETTGLVVAERNLANALNAGRPAIAWLDLTTLPYSGLPDSLQRLTYHVAAVDRLTDGKAEVRDLPDRPLVIQASALARARAAIRSQKNRLLVLDGKPRFDAATAIRGAIDRSVRTLAKEKAWNRRLGGIERWGDLLTNAKVKDGWPQVFPAGAPLFAALCRGYIFIALYGTGGTLLRRLYAEFLAEAAVAAEIPGLAQVAARYRGLADDWGRLAAAFLPTSVPALDEARRLLDRFRRGFDEQAAEWPGSALPLLKRLSALSAEVNENFPLSSAEIADLLADLRGRLVSLHGGESAALEELGAAIR